jgi:pyruvate ferredoxin oxidoreductase alpha subunit
LGGRSISIASLKRIVLDARAERLNEPHFLDLNTAVIDAAQSRRLEQRRAGPVAEQVLRAVNAVGAKAT